jgi:hypothetical protein
MAESVGPRVLATGDFDGTGTGRVVPGRRTSPGPRLLGGAGLIGQCS